MLSIVGWQIWMSWISDVKSTRQGYPERCTVSFICRFQNGSTALHAAVMGGNIRTVLLLLCANADPNLPNKVRHRPVDWMKTHTHKALSLELVHFYLLCFAEQWTSFRSYKERSHPQSFTSKSHKRRQLIATKTPSDLPMVRWWCALRRNKRKTTTLCQTYSATIRTVQRPYCCHMLIKPGLNLSNWTLHLSAMCILSLMLLYNNIFFS